MRCSLRFETQEHQIRCVDAIVGRISESDEGLRADPSGLRNEKPDNRLDVLMETGTGKTLTYLMCIMEINKKFGTNKFMIVVPSTAIRQGIIQNAKLAKDYLFNEYAKHMSVLVWPENDNAVYEFLGRGSAEPTVLITTYSSFNKIKNRLNKGQESVMGGMVSLWDCLINAKPVVVMDEPHKLAGLSTTKYLNRMKDGGSLFLRFGASFPEGEQALSNVVYELGSADAFNRKLVKEIEVCTVSHGDEVGGISVSNLHSGKSFDIRYVRNGRLIRKIVPLHSDLGVVTGLPEYAGCSVSKVTSKKVTLDNNMTFFDGFYEVGPELMKSMIAKAIELHFKREEELFDNEIKALSLFFIPHVADYRGDNPRIRNMFEEAYRRIRRGVYDHTTNPAYKRYLDGDYANGELVVHQGYFAEDKGTNDQQILHGVNKILNKKEELLSFDTPLRFVFSVRALQEGWDNPNIFTICKLTNTNSDTTRRQQVGRGIRLAVNQEMARMTHDRVSRMREHFSRVNALNMVVSSHEQDFFEQLQKEIGAANETAPLTLAMLAERGFTDNEAATLWGLLRSKGVIDNSGNPLRSVYDFLAQHETLFDMPSDKFAQLRAAFRPVHAVREYVDRKLVAIRKDKWKEFQELWEILNRRASIQYRGIDDASIIAGVRDRFNRQTINAVRETVVRKAKAEGKGDWTQRKTVTEMTTGMEGKFFRRHPLEEYVMDMAKEMKLPLRFMLKLFGSIDKNKVKANPAEAGSILRALIYEEMHSAVLAKVEYSFSENIVYGNGLQTNTGARKESIPHTLLGDKYEAYDKPNYLYDAIAYDSDIERDCIKNDPETVNENRITVFAKLPPIPIMTPYKTYSPDFAYLVRGRTDRMFLVVETKGYDKDDDIPKEEWRDIEYGRKFFECLRKTLPPGIDIRYQHRINKNSLADILGSVMG